MLHNTELTKYYISQLAHIKQRYDYLLQQVFDTMADMDKYGNKTGFRTGLIKRCQKEMLQLDSGRQLIYEKVFNR